MTIHKLGKYQLLKKLGRGGYGTVYRALDLVLEVERAVKVLHPALVADPTFIERFRREAKFAAQMKHPHIVPVYDLDEDQGRYFLAMEYLPGRSLKDLLTQEGPLPFTQALEITRQIADALDYIHGRDLVHRDVKPGNILFDEEKRHPHCLPVSTFECQIAPPGPLAQAPPGQPGEWRPVSRPVANNTC